MNNRPNDLNFLQNLLPLLKHCLWKEIFSQQRIRDFKILQGIYFAYDVGIISSYSNRTRYQIEEQDIKQIEQDISYSNRTLLKHCAIAKV